MINADIKVVFLTMYPDVTYAARAFEVGASGYVLNHSASSELLTAIHDAIKGRTYVSSMIAGELIQSYKEGAHLQEGGIDKLTFRQKEVLKLLAEGHSAKEIADILCISPRTVEFHKYRMMEELNIKTSAELVGYALKHGIVTIRINKIDWIYCFLGFQMKPRNNHPAFSEKRKPKRPIV